jgi:uncharacterized membrane protein (Fun14 family)
LSELRISKAAAMPQDALVIALLIGSGFIAGFVFGYGVRAFISHRRRRRR